MYSHTEAHSTQLERLNIHDSQIVIHDGWFCDWLVSTLTRKRMRRFWLAVVRNSRFTVLVTHDCKLAALHALTCSHSGQCSTTAQL